MVRRGGSVARVGALVLGALFGAGASPSAQAGAPSPLPEQALSADKIEELAALGRLWGEVEFVHPWLPYRDIDWDAALLAVVPAALEARGPDEFRAVVAELLAVLDDPATRVVPAAALEASHVVGGPAAALERDGAGLVLVRAPVSEQGTEVLRRLAHEPRNPPFTGAILDLRGAVAAESLAAYRAEFEAALAGLFRGSCRMPSRRHVAYSGYPPERGQTSGGYTCAYQETPSRSLAGRAEQGIPLVFVVDERPRGIGDHLLALQLAGLATIVLESPYETLDDREEDVEAVRLDLPYGIRVELRASERIGPDGELGFRPDVHVPPSADVDAALRQARAVLGGERVAERPAYAKASPLVRRPERDYAAQGTLGPEHRLLALFRYWCTLWSFQPYLRQLERPWEEVLSDFVPRFLAAEEASAYELAVAELAASTHDSHSYTLSRTLLQTFGTWVPSVALRFVEDRPVVVAVLDPAIQDVQVGDVLRSIEGTPVEERIEALRPLLAYSTPQALHDKLRDLLLAGDKDTLVRATFEGPQGIRECSLARGEQYVQAARSTPAFGILPSGHGYIDLERLQVEQVPAAFAAIATAPGLVFDLRGYPHGTAPHVARRLGEGKAPVADEVLERAIRFLESGD